MTNVGTLVLGFFLGFPAGRKAAFREAKTRTTSSEGWK
jgi:hypothetical protein